MFSFEFSEQYKSPYNFFTLPIVARRVQLLFIMACVLHRAYRKQRLYQRNRLSEERKIDGAST